MSQYLYPIKIAIYTFPIVALLISLPFLIYQYRKYGYFNKLRALVVYTFILYLMCAYFLIILPLPKVRDVASLQRPGTKYYQLIPFKFITDFLTKTKVEIKNPLTYMHLVKESVFYQAVFNFLLLFPLGVYLRYHFKKGLIETTIITFFVSLFFEITQITALYGYYTAPYRIFDVDDLILNTLGGVLGYFLAQIIINKLPHATDIDKEFNVAESVVSVLRRFIAFGIDSVIIWLILFIPIAILAKFFNKYIFMLVNIIITLIVWYIYFIKLTIKNNGTTVGKNFVKIKLKEQDYNTLSKKKLIIRYIIIYLMFYGINTIMTFINSLTTSNQILQIIITLLQAVYNIILVLYLLKNTFSKDKIFLHDKVSKIINVVNI